ncbi:MULTISPECIES: putative RNA methyltransferase [unclassified Frankia]|uniref:putative RNA methyltransferase n=2 Tax=Frankia TaxID=1854 RepID=UPI001EF670E4|nr:MULTISPECIES: methyltransferase domain-containing protein [unclassified Frankia]
MIHAVLTYLTCPICGLSLTVGTGQVRCPDGHAYDLARGGHLTLTTGRAAEVAGDHAEMVRSREAFLAGGHYAALADQLGAVIRNYTIKNGAIGGEQVFVDVGAGPGYYLAHLLNLCPSAVGIALDVSRQALRRAARAHPRIGAVGVDLRGPLPVRTGTASVVLDVFAPRNVTEMHRILRPDGHLVIVTPTVRHLAGLVDSLGLVTVDERKPERLRSKLAGSFVQRDQWTLDLDLSLTAQDLLHLVMMGPTAHHRRAADIQLLIEERWPAGAASTASFMIELYEPYGTRSRKEAVP